MSETKTETAREFVRDVGPRTIQVTLDTRDLLLTESLDDDARQVMSTIGLVATLIHDAQYNFEVSEAEYRHWREDQKKLLVERDPKLAEWKVKAHVEGHPRFVDHKLQIAQFSADQEFLKVYFQGLKMKADMVRALLYRDKAQSESE